MDENRRKDSDPLLFSFFSQYGGTFTVWSEHKRGERAQKEENFLKALYIYILIVIPEKKVSGTPDQCIKFIHQSF